MIDDYAKMMGIVNIEELKKAARRRKMLDGNGCQLCDYNGYTINHTGKSLMCSCAKDKIYKELFLSANVPRAYISKSIDDWNTRKDSNGNELGKQQLVSERVFTLLKFYEKKLPKICEFEDISFIHTGGIKQKLHSILFEGNIGSGKTFIAAVMVQSSLKKGYPAKYYDWSELVSCCSDYNKKTELDEIVEAFDDACRSDDLQARRPKREPLGRLCRHLADLGRLIQLATRAGTGGRAPRARTGGQRRCCRGDGIDNPLKSRAAVTELDLSALPALVALLVAVFSLPFLRRFFNAQVVIANRGVVPGGKVLYRELLPL